jgi:SNF family Na+-dependent transporter
VKITVVLPWLLIAILIIYNATLEGSLDGVKAYLGKWDMSTLQKGPAWSDAAGQVVFSLGAGLGALPCRPTKITPFPMQILMYICMSPTHAA